MKSLLAGGIAAGWIVGVLAAALLGGCATASASTQLSIGKGLAAATSGLDAAVESASAAHAAGLLGGGDWTQAQGAAKTADALIDQADAAYLAGDLTSAQALLNQVAPSIAAIQSVTPAPAAAANAAP